MLRGQPPKGAPGDARPVYELPDGRLGIPTGFLFARFREGTDAGAQLQALGRAGYEIAEVAGWAPHAAFIRAVGGDPGRSLGNVAALENVSGIEKVEPQMLTRAVRRR